MKKKNIFYTGIIALGLSVTGCSDSFLDMAQDGVYDQLDSETKANWYVNAIYELLYKGFNEPNKTLVYKTESRDKMTEEQWGINDKTDPNASYYTIDDLGKGVFYASYFGTKLEAGKKSPESAYHQIRYCNNLFEELDKNEAKFDKEFIKKLRGQNYFLRAAQMFDLVRTYGSVPIVTTVLNAEASDNGLPRASVTKCVEQIVKDLNAAAEMLPDSWAGNDYGRVTKGAALALKSRVLLTYASPIFNRDWDNPSNIRWQKALKAAQEAQTLMTEKGLDGIQSAKDWEDMLCKATNTVDHKETIFLRLTHHGDDDNATNNGWENKARLTSQGGGGGIEVPIELIDMFPNADGSLISENEKLANKNLRFFVNRDPRFYRTFAFNGMVWGYKELPNDTVWAYRYMSLKIPVGTSSSTGETLYDTSYGYSEENDVPSPVFIRKMTNRQLAKADFEYSGAHVYDYRYAELTLNLAECYAATGQVDLCKQELGKLRARVGMEKGAQNYGLDTYVTDRHTAISACLRERLIELAYEGKRCWDTWRWLLYDGGQGFAGNGESLKLSDVNTCQALGLTPLNETHRTSRYVDVKPELYTPSADPNKEILTPDPLLADKETLCADPDSPNFQTQLEKLADFWETHFVLTAPSTPGDKDGSNNEVNISWKANYYISGINKQALTNNPWLGQTVGWGDQDGNIGTIHFQDNEVLAVD